MPVPTSYNLGMAEQNKIPRICDPFPLRRLRPVRQQPQPHGLSEASTRHHLGLEQATGPLRQATGPRRSGAGVGVGMLRVIPNS